MVLSGSGAFRRAAERRSKSSKMPVLRLGHVRRRDLLSQPPGGPWQEIEFYDFATGEVSRVAMLGDLADISLGMSVSPDGRWITYVKGDSESDIMLVENFR